MHLCLTSHLHSSADGEVHEAMYMCDGEVVYNSEIVDATNELRSGLKVSVVYLLKEVLY